MQPDFDTAMTIPPADDASDADTPAAVVRLQSPVVAETEHQGDDAGYADTLAAVVRPASPVVAETERPGEVAGDADTQAAAVATPTRTPDHNNTPRFRSVRPKDGAVIATLNQLMGMVKSLQADNRQLC